MTGRRSAVRIANSLALVACCFVPACGGFHEASSETGPELTLGCSLQVTQNVYDGPNYWGTLSVKNDGPSSAVGLTVDFDVPSGVHCTNDTVPSGATLSPLNGSGASAVTKSNHCRFVWASGSLAVGATKTFNYSTDSTGFRAASNVVAGSPSCNADAGGSDSGGDSGRSGGDSGSSGGGTDAGGVTACPMLQPAGGATSKWARVDVPGHLAYATLPTGERLLDFSRAGYMGGGVPIPAVPVRATVRPSGGSDDTAAIQAAIDAVSRLGPSNGVRGAVLLSAGTFQVNGTLSIATSGVVLRGSGSGAQGTLLQIGGAPRTVLTIGGTGSWTEGTPTIITDDYVPSGATSFHVASTAALKVGMPVLVDRPVTAAWIHFMGMDTLVRNGAPETWLSAGSVLHADRAISAIQGNLVSLDMPISDTFDVSKWGAGARASVSPYSFAGRIQQVGVESMHLVAPKQTVPISQPTFSILSMDAVENAWVRDVAADEFTGGFSIGGTAKWVTVEDSRVARTAPIDGSSGYPFQYSVDGQAVLVQRCSSTGNNVFSYATQARTPGPNVVLDFKASGSPINLQPHQRWATGLLLDRIDSPTGGIALMNRGWDGSGHGWAIGFGVLWNSVGSSLLIQQPPGAANWAIGSAGTLTTAAAPGSTTTLPEGIIDSHGVVVAPQSLYLAQLCERLGPAALTATGY